MNIQFSIHEIDKVAKLFLETYSKDRSFAFFAEMGSGKTTFVNALCRQLGVEDNISSPTFSIINEYEIPNSSVRIFHMDWYRLKNEEDAIEAGVQDVMQNNVDYIFIEWPEIAENLLPKNIVKVSIKFLSENEREIINS